MADPISAVNNVDDYEESARLLAATTLRWGPAIPTIPTIPTATTIPTILTSTISTRNVLGTKTLGEILSQREDIANDIKVGEEVVFTLLRRTWMRWRGPGAWWWRGSR